MEVRHTNFNLKQLVSTKLQCQLVYNSHETTITEVLISQQRKQHSLLPDNIHKKPYDSAIASANLDHKIANKGDPSLYIECAESGEYGYFMWRDGAAGNVRSEVGNISTLIARVVSRLFTEISWIARGCDNGTRPPLSLR